MLSKLLGDPIKPSPSEASPTLYALRYVNVFARNKRPLMFLRRKK